MLKIVTFAILRILFCSHHSISNLAQITGENAVGQYL